jgi:hypothetical protein
MGTALSPRLDCYAKFNGDFVLVALRGHAALRPMAQKKLSRSSATFRYKRSNWVGGRKETVKTGFRARDAKNAKKLLQGELVEFVYESLDVTFEELTAKVINSPSLR